MFAPRPEDEEARLASLHDYQVPDTASEDAYDDITRLAATLCGTPIAAVTLVETDRQLFKSIQGIKVQEIPRDLSFCTYTILQTDVMVVPDASLDPRFAANPFVTGEPHLRFYAGAPLISPDGQALGSLCVLDHVPHTLTPEQESALRVLAHQVITQMELTRRVAAQDRLMAEQDAGTTALRRSEAKFRRIIDVSPVPLCLNDDRQNITLLNAKFVQTFGYTQADIPTLADWWRQAYPDPEYRRRVETTWQARLEQAAQAGTAFEPLEVTVHSKDGTQRTVMADAAALEPGFRGQHLVVLHDITERVRTEQEKAGLADYNRLLLESTAEGIYGIGLDGRCTFINTAGAAMLGYTLAEMEGQDMHALIHHSHSDGSPYPVEDCPIYRTLREGIACQVETEVLWRRDGTAFDAEYAAFPLRSEAGVVGAVVTFSDITERRRAEEAMRRSEARMAEAQRIGGIGNWELDTATWQFTWSAQVFRLMEFDSAGAVPDYDTIMARYSPDDRVERDRMFAQSLEKGEPYQCDLRLVLPSGTPRTIHLVGHPVADKMGRVLRIVGTVQDITARVQAEETIRRLAGAVSSATEGIIVTDADQPDHPITYVNPAFLALTGYAADEVLGRNCRFLQGQDTDPEAKRRLRRAIREGHSCRVALLNYRKDGTAFWNDLTIAPMHDAQGRLTDYVGIQHDVTEQRLEQERLQEANTVLAVQQMQLEAANAELEALATTDPLTGLLNYRAFHRRLAEATAQGSGTPLAVAVLDLDDFRFFNSVYGQAVGDAVLRQVAARLREIGGPADIPAHFGGDEFWVLLMDIAESAVPVEIEARLRAALTGLSYQSSAEATAIPITVTVGAALLPRRGENGRAIDGQKFIEQAEERLRWAKSGGGIETPADSVRAQAGRSLEGFTMLDALVTAVDNKDRYTRRHSEDVLAYSLQIAQGMGLDDAAQYTVAVAALLHDVGKIGVPDHILRKPGYLTDDEFQAVQQHPQMGAIIVQAVPGLEETLDAVRHHHERWDGQGYPFGLTGEETPLIARLMAVADAYSAMTTDRPYRKGMAPDKARAILEAGAGTQWDPACVRAFLQTQDARRAVDLPAM